MFLLVLVGSLSLARGQERRVARQIQAEPLVTRLWGVSTDIIGDADRNAHLLSQVFHLGLVELAAQVGEESTHCRLLYARTWIGNCKLSCQNDRDVRAAHDALSGDSIDPLVPTVARRGAAGLIPARASADGRTADSPERHFV